MRVVVTGKHGDAPRGQVVRDGVVAQGVLVQPVADEHHAHRTRGRQPRHHPELRKREKREKREEREEREGCQ